MMKNALPLSLLRCLIALSMTTLLLLPAVPQASAEDTVSIIIDPTSGGVDESFALSVVVRNAQSVATPQLSPSDYFAITYIGPREELRIINGNVQRRAVFDYQLTPKKTGQLLTPSLTIQVDGVTITPSPLTVSVSERRSPLPSDTQSDYFIRQKVVGRDRIYVGEQVVNVIEIGTTVKLYDPQLGDLTYPGFRSESMEDTTAALRTSEGRVFNVTSIRRALFALASGEAQIAERTLSAQVRRRTRSRLGSVFDSMDDITGSIFDQFVVSGELSPLTLTSNKLQVTVDPLPAPPPGLPILTGAPIPVGESSISVHYDPSTLQFGKSKSVHVVIQSKGNIAPLKSLGLTDTPSYRIYEESPQTKLSEESGLLVTTKTFPLTIVPLAGDQVTVAPLRMSFFDPSSGGYRAVASQPISFAVLGAPAEQPTPTPTPFAPTVAPERSDSGNDGEGLFAALLRFSEERLSPELLRLLGALLIATLLTVLLIRPVMKRARRRNRITTTITTVTDPRELYHRVREELSAHFRISPEAPFRAELRRSVPERETLYEIERLLDRMEEDIYGLPLPGGEREELKRDIIRLLQQLSSTRLRKR